jgi:hypothetical protein
VDERSNQNRNRGVGIYHIRLRSFLHSMFLNPPKPKELTTKEEVIAQAKKVFIGIFTLCGIVAFIYLLKCFKC